MPSSKWYCIKKGRRIEYSRASQYFQGPEEQANDCYPTLIPNWDHFSRFRQSGHILVRSTPEKFKRHALVSFNNISHKAIEDRIVFLKSWNEWAEGNYMEPDLGFIEDIFEALKEAIQDIFYH